MYSTAKLVFNNLTSRLRGQLLFAVCMMLLSSLLEVIGIGLVIPFIYSLSDQDIIIEYLAQIVPNFIPPVGHQLTILISLVFLFFLAASYILKIYNLIYYNRFAYNCGQIIISRIFRMHLDQQYKIFKSIQSSQVYDIYNQKAYILINNILIPMVTMASSAITIVFISGILFVVEPLNSLFVVVATLVFYISIIGYTRQKVRTLGKTANQASDDLIQLVQRVFRSIREIKLYRQEQNSANQFDKINYRLRYSQSSLQIITQIPRQLIEMLLVVILVFIVISSAVAQESFVTIISTLVFITMAGQRLFPYFQQFYHSFASFESGVHHANSIFSIQANTTLSNVVGSQQQERVEPIDSLTLENVAVELDNCTLIKNFSARFEVGKMIGIIGPSGSGKTTMVEAAIGLLPICKGAMFVNNNKVEFSDIQRFYDQIAYVPQEVYLFPGTIRENIFFDKAPIDKTDIYNKSELVDWLSQLAAGDETIITEDAGNISGGQRQRIGIARALARSPRLLIMDESTNALDETTQQKIITNLKTPDSCVIVISHSLTIMPYFDEVIELR